MNILFFDAAYPPPILGGKEKQAHILARELNSQGSFVKAISYLHNANKTGNYEGVEVIRLPKGPFSLFFLFFHLIILRKNFRILHIHTPSRIGMSLAFAGKLLFYKIVFKFPGQGIINYSPHSLPVLWRCLIKAIADILVVLESNTLSKLEEFGVDKKKIFLASNGVSILHQKNKYQKVNGCVTILFVGRLVSLKNCDVLITACSLLSSRFENWKLEIVGDGPERSNLELQVASLNLDRKIKFFGFRSDIIKLMKTSDLLVLPSRSEGMSNVLLEAISIGLPVIATEVGAAKTVLGEFGEQFLCKPNDPEDLSNKIETLSIDPGLRIDYGTYLYERCSRLFSIEMIAKQYLLKYREL